MSEMTIREHLESAGYEIVDNGLIGIRGSSYAYVFPERGKREMKDSVQNGWLHHREHLISDRVGEPMATKLSSIDYVRKGEYGETWFSRGDHSFWTDIPYDMLMAELEKGEMK